MKITRKSDYSGIERSMELDITDEQVLDHMKGTLIQKAFPNLSQDEREFYKSGITKEEWNKLFPEN